MNVVQLVRKARLGCDAIFPGGSPSTLWSDDELVDMATEANEDLNLALRLVRKKWGEQIVTSTTPAFSRDGETYDPTVQLAPAAGSTTILLPPDLGAMTRILCTSDTTVRFVPADYESQYFIDMEQGARNVDGTFTAVSSSMGMTYYYDLIGARTLVVTPPFAGTVTLSLSYTPMKRPLYYSNAGTIALVQGAQTIVGLGTSWMSDGIYTSTSNQMAELLVGMNTLADVSVRLDRDYPQVTNLATDGSGTLLLPWPGATVSASSFILAMVPTLPREYHRWIARMMSVYMLGKINPDLAEKSAQAVMRKFDALIRPTAGQRQTQESTVTDSEPLFGGLADF